MNSSFWDKKMVLDGGMGTELVRCGAQKVDSHRLWSSISNIEEPKVVIQAHLNFINAGSNVIITNSYQSNQFLLMDELKISKEDADKYLSSTVELASKARAQSEKENIFIAGSIGPYPDCPASEYNPEYLKRMSLKELIDWHRPRFELLANSSVDLLAIETIPGLKEAEALLILLSDYSKPAYISFACRDGKTNAGESFDEIKDLINRFQSENLRGIGINCSYPNLVSSFGLKMKQSFPNHTLVAYPNTAENWTNEENKWGETESKWTGKKVDIAEFVDEWVEIGYTWIGGCCRVEPDQIKEIAKTLQK